MKCEICRIPPRHQFLILEEQIFLRPTIGKDGLYFGYYPFLPSKEKEKMPYKIKNYRKKFFIRSKIF